MQCTSQFLRDLDSEIVYCTRPIDHDGMHVGAGPGDMALQWNDAAAFTTMQHERPVSQLQQRTGIDPNDELPVEQQILVGYFPEHGDVVTISTRQQLTVQDAKWDRLLLIDNAIAAVSVETEGVRWIVPWGSLHAISRDDAKQVRSE